MGSIEKACISGFLCRLCSEMHRTVIHIYGDHGQRLFLVEKINNYLPITISPTDPLPKTICKTCLHRVEQHYILLKRLNRMRQERKLKLMGSLNSKRNADNVSVSSAECSDDDEPLTTTDKSSSNKPTTSINNARNNDNQNNPGSTRRQSHLANATLIYPATGRNNLFPTT